MPKKGRQRRGRKSRSFTIADFCRRNHISRTTFYALSAAGLGPVTMKIGRLVRISARAERDWIRRMEAGEAANFNTAAEGSDSKEAGSDSRHRTRRRSRRRRRKDQ